MSCKGPDYSAANFRRGVRSGGTEGVDNGIYAHIDCATSQDEFVKGWCLNCGQKLNWLNAKPPFLCHRCQEMQCKGFLVLFANSSHIVGVPVMGAAVQYPDLAYVVNFRKNGRPVTTSLVK